MDKAFEIRLAPGAEGIGLVLMLQDLLTQNFDQHPEKIIDFRKLRLKTGLTVPDAEVALTMEFDGGILTIYPGILKDSQLRITAEADMVLALSNVRIKWGLPYYFDEPGKEVLGAMRSGRIKIKGLIRHFPGLMRLSRIMSVH
jgi:hypothetical protein